MTFKLHRLMVLIGSTFRADFGVTRSTVKVTGPNVNFCMKTTLTFCMKALYSGTTAPMTFKLHRLMVLIGSTKHTDFGVTRSNVKVTGPYVNLLHEGPLLGNYCTHDLQTSQADGIY